jgi:hypothetical protein
MVLARSIAVAVFTVALAGCGTLTVPADKLPQSTGTALVEQWPLAVALLVAPGVEAISDRAVGDIGAHVGPTVAWALQQRFASVATAPASSIDGTFRVLGASAADGHVEFRIQLANASGTPTDEWTVQGKPLASILMSDAYASALSDAGAVLITTLPERPAVRAWLADHGVHLPADGPILRSAPAASREAKAVALLPEPDGAADPLVGYRARSCLGERLRPALEVFDRDALRQRLYPWLERSVAPSSAAGLLDFLGEPALRATLEAMGVHHIVLFGGATSTKFDKGGILCGGGMGGGGCLGFSWGTRDSSFHAIVLDIRQGTTAGDPHSHRTANVYMPAFVIPIPLIAATEGEACDELAAQVRSLVLRPGPK